MQGVIHGGCDLWCVTRGDVICGLGVLGQGPCSTSQSPFLWGCPGADGGNCPAQRRGDPKGMAASTPNHVLKFPRAHHSQPPGTHSPSAPNSSQLSWHRGRKELEPGPEGWEEGQERRQEKRGRRDGEVETQRQRTRQIERVEKEWRAYERMEE